MQSLLCSLVCPCFSLYALLSKSSLSFNICLGVCFNHYIECILQTCHCIHYTHLLLIGIALPNWFIPNSPHPPFFPPSNSSSVHSKNIFFNSYSLKGIPQPALHIEKIIQLTSCNLLQRAFFAITFLSQVKEFWLLYSLHYARFCPKL